MVELFKSLSETINSSFKTKNFWVETEKSKYNFLNASVFFGCYQLELTKDICITDIR